MNASHRNKFVCKLVKLRDQPLTRLLALTCSMTESELLVKIIELTSKSTQRFGESVNSMAHSVIYQYAFREKRQVAQRPQELFSIQRQHLEEAITEVCTSG